ncbi:MAG: amidohydrolase, partial [Saprospiraceae bacterium]
MMKKILFLFVLTVCLGFTTMVQAQDAEQLAAPVTRTFVLKNANIVQKPGQVITAGMVLVKDGLIQEVGKTVTIPADAEVINADSMYVYAGFIDGLSS